MSIDTVQCKKAYAFVKKQWPDAQPSCGLILGSGWSEVVEAFEVEATLSYRDIPGLGSPGVAGHAGQLAWARSAGVETFIFQGRRHLYEGVGWTPIAIPVYILKQAGAGIAVLTNAAGGVKKHLQPGELMILTDHINNLTSHPLIGPHDETWGPRFPDQSQVYDPRLITRIENAASSVNEGIHHGVYIALSGPTYETPAEVKAYESWGADAIGMSTVPEAILASAAGMRVCALSCITNLAVGISPTPLSHQEVIEATTAAMPRMKNVLLALWSELSHEI